MFRTTQQDEDAEWIFLIDLSSCEILALRKCPIGILTRSNSYLTMKCYQYLSKLYHVKRPLSTFYLDGVDWWLRLVNSLSKAIAIDR